MERTTNVRPSAPEASRRRASIRLGWKSWLCAAMNDSAGLLERGLDRDRVVQRGAERFFAEDRLAGPGRGENRLGVQVVRQADVDGVEIGFRQHRGEIGIGRHLAVAERSGQIPRPLRRDVGDGDHLGSRGVALPGAGMDVTHPARANDADFQLLHALSVLLVSSFFLPHCVV